MTPTDLYIQILSTANHLTTASPRLKIERTGWHLSEGSNYTEHLTLDGTRVGRDFILYKRMAEIYGMVGAILDFSAAMALVADKCPEIAAGLKEDMKELAAEFDYADQREVWLEVWR